MIWFLWLSLKAPPMWPPAWALLSETTGEAALSAGPVVGVATLGSLSCLQSHSFPYLKKSSHLQPHSSKVWSCRIQEVRQPSFILFYFLCPVFFKLAISLLVYSHLYSWLLLRCLFKSMSYTHDLFVKWLMFSSEHAFSFVFYCGIFFFSIWIG